MIGSSMLAMRARVFSIAAALLLVSFAAGADAAAGVTLTVEQAVARARTNQPLIQQALAAEEAARARVGEAQSQYYPTVSGTASYTRL